jgi:hypothetical protein
MPGPNRANTAEPPDVQALADRALAELAKRHTEWAHAARQDAIESVRRMSRWHVVRRGCRVPIHDLYYVSMRRAVELLARKFVDHAAPPTAAYLGLQAAELVLTGNGCIESPDLPGGATDLLIRRGTWEKPLAYLIRFEAEVSDHLEHLYRDQIRPQLASTINQITAAWTIRAAT